MADEPVADPDAMWKAGYLAPADEGETDDPGGDDAATAVVRQLRPARSPVAAGPQLAARDRTAAVPICARRTGEEVETPRRPADGPSRSHWPTVARRRAWRWSSSTAGGICVGSDRDATASAPGHQPRRRSPNAPAPAWTAELDTGHVTGVIGTRSTIVVLELVTNDLVGLSADSGAERWRVQRRAFAQHRPTRGGRRGGDRARRGEHRQPFDRGLRPRIGRAVVARGWVRPRRPSLPTKGSIYRLPAGVTDVAIERLDPRTGEGLNAARVAVLERRLGARGDGRRRLRRGLRPADSRTRRGPDRHRRRGRGIGVRRPGGRVSDETPTIRLYGSTGDELSSLQTTVDRPEQFDVTNGAGADVARHGRPGDRRLLAVRRSDRAGVAHRTRAGERDHRCRRAHVRGRADRGRRRTERRSGARRRHRDG